MHTFFSCRVLHTNKYERKLSVCFLFHTAIYLDRERLSERESVVQRYMHIITSTIESTLTPIYSFELSIHFSFTKIFHLKLYPVLETIHTTIKAR